MKPVAPPKIECLDSVQGQQVQLHVEVLEDIMRTMERELYLLKSRSLIKTTADNNSNTITTFSDEEFDTNTPTDPIQIPAHQWQLIFNSNGGLTVHTDIQSYTNLLNHIEAFNTQLNYCHIVKQPTLASLSTGGGYLHRHMISSILRKGSYKATLACIQRARTIRWKIENVPKLDLSLRLVETYFSCRFLHRVIFHQRTFYDLFINVNNPETSPVVCALSAAVLTMHCKHVLNIVPYKDHMSLGEYYFEKARLAISKQFDEPNMETMVTYLHLSMYQANLLRPQEASMYLEMAVRIRQILADEVYSKLDTKKRKSPPNKLMREYEMFQRLNAGFRDTVQFIQFINNQRGIPIKKSSAKDHIQTVCSCDVYYEPTPMPDENKEIVRAIMKEQYIGLIAKVVGPYFSRVRFGQDDLIPLSFLLKTEEDLKQVYYKQIPLEYQLAPSIFEDGIGDVEFKRRLNEEGRCDVVSVTLAARFHQSLVAIHEPFLPVMTKRTRILEEQANGYDSPTLGSLSSSNTLSSDEEEEEEEEEEQGVLSVHTLRAQEVCFKSSMAVVQLLEYQCTELEACTIPIPSLLCAWDNLIRNSCLGMTETELKGVHEYLTERDIQVSRSYALRCMDIVRKGYLFHGAERGIWEYYEEIEQQLIKAMKVNRKSTVKYWEPPQ